jgi:hypothetical protein
LCLVLESRKRLGAGPILPILCNQVCDLRVLACEVRQVLYGDGGGGDLDNLPCVGCAENGLRECLWPKRGEGREQENRVARCRVRYRISVLASGAARFDANTLNGAITKPQPETLERGPVEPLAFCQRDARSPVRVAEPELNPFRRGFVVYNYRSLPRRLRSFFDIRNGRGRDLESLSGCADVRNIRVDFKVIRVLGFGRRRVRRDTTFLQHSRQSSQGHALEIC